MSTFAKVITLRLPLIVTTLLVLSRSTSVGATTGVRGERLQQQDTSSGAQTPSVWEGIFRAVGMPIFPDVADDYYGDDDQWSSLQIAARKGHIRTSSYSRRLKAKSSKTKSSKTTNNEAGKSNKGKSKGKSKSKSSVKSQKPTPRPTPRPTTAIPVTAAPTTANPTTANPTTSNPTTASPTTAGPTTLAIPTVTPGSPSAAPTTAIPTVTVGSPSSQPTTTSPTTATPTTTAPTTAGPTVTPGSPSAAPTTVAPTTGSPTTASPTSAAPTTGTPTTAAPITTAPTTAGPTVTPGSPSAAPTTAAPTTSNPTTASPTTAAPTTGNPTTAAPTTSAPTSAGPTVTLGSPSAAPTTAAPTSAAPTTGNPTTANPTTAAPSTASPTTTAPTTASPTPGVSAAAAQLRGGISLTTKEAKPAAVAATNAPTTRQQCNDNVRHYHMNVDIHIHYLDDKVVPCNDDANHLYDPLIGGHVRDALNRNFATTVTDWHGTAAFGPFLFDSDQRVDNVNTDALVELDSDLDVQGGSCPTRTIACPPDVADTCRWGCLTIETTDCGTPRSYTTSWSDSLSADIQNRLASLGYACLGISDQLRVVITEPTVV